MFIAALVLYYQLFLTENLGRDFDLFKDHLYQASENVSAKINSYYPDRARINSYLDLVAAQQNMKITIYDVDGNKLMGSDRRKGYGLNLELKNFTVVGHKTIYVVEMVYPFSIANFGELNSFKKIRNVALVLLIILIGLLSVYLHFSLVRPLTLLNQELENVHYRNPRLGVRTRTSFKRHDELGDLARKIDEMHQRLASSYREQAEMIASISHDLKTPLTSILGFLERLMSRSISEEKQTEYYRIVYQKAQDIQELVTEFNEYVTSDFGDRETGLEESVNCKRFFETLCAEYQAELAGKKLDFIYNYEMATTAEVWLAIDPQKIRRVFANLVSNSLKYAEQLGRIKFNCRVDENQVVFTVEDDGPGVPPEELAMIFEQFYRVDKSRSREKGGSGLGLAICRRIIEHHGGTIGAYLPQTGGLGVTFSLPSKFHN